jgi:sulfoxide reductase heme-binding subunit YedZ
MTIWHIARGAGLAALLLLTISTVIGAVMTGRKRSSSRVVWNHVHRVTASLGLGALLVHVTSILADPWAHVGWVGSIVPFTAGYRPTWVGAGTLAVYTFVLVAAVGVARARIATSERGARAWRWLHGLAYVGWGLAMLHGFNSGTDSGVSWVRGLYVACGLAVAAAVSVRVALERGPDLIRTTRPRLVTR